MNQIFTNGKRTLTLICFLLLVDVESFSLPETNSKFAPENGWLGDYFPLGRPIFRGYVSFREGRSLIFRHTHPIVVRSCRLTLATKWESYLKIFYFFHISYSPLWINIHNPLWTNVLAEANPYLFFIFFKMCRYDCVDMNHGTCW